MPRQLLLKALPLLSLLALAQPAMAHSPLEQSSPKDDAVLDQAPAQLELVFRHPVHLASVSLVPASGGKVIAVASGHMDEAIARYELPLPELAPGDYTVDWRALASDGHLMSGSFSFSLASSAPRS